MVNNKTWMKFGLAVFLSITMAGCFSNPVDPIGSGGSSGSIPVNSSDVTTSSITASYSQASSQGIYVSVRDQNGDALNAAYFNNASFSVTQNGSLIPSGSITVSTASGSGQSISSSLVLDYSGSMGTQDISDMENAAVTFVNNMQAADRGEVIKFDDRVLLVQSYTSDKSALQSAITGAVSLGMSTALYDATYLGLTDTAQESGQRAVIAFTDGENNSGTQTLTSVVDYAQDHGIPIYTIGLGYANASVLQSMATQTNGLYYEAPTSAELATIYSRIAQIFNNTLIISWPSFVYRSGDVIIITVTYSCSTGTYSSTISIVLP